MYIKMNNNTVIEGQCIPQGPNLLQFAFQGEIPAPELLESVELQNRHGIIFGHYEGYGTVYRELENGYILSNDGSVYVEPPEPDPIPDIPPEESEAPGMTLEERVRAVEQVIYNRA